MTSRRPFRPVLRTQRDLESLWRRLMAHEPFGGHSVWLLVIGPDDRPIPRLTEFPEADEPPDAEEMEELAELVRRIAALGGARVAFLRSRPGSPTVTADDREWALALYAVGRAAGFGCEVVHQATAGSVVPLPMDEVLAEPA